MGALCGVLRVSAKPSPFDAETEAALAKLREKTGADHDASGRFTRAAPGLNAAGEAAAELAQALSDAPPVGIPAAEVHRIGQEAVQAVRDKLDRAEKGDGFEQVTQSGGGDIRRRPGGDADPKTTNPAADEEAGEDDPSVEAEGQAEVAAPKGKHAPSKRLGHGDGANRFVAKDSTVSRFANTEAEPDRVWIMPADHVAAVEGRTMFPSSVVSTFESPRFLVSGHNNPKLGKVFRKGPWDGFPLYQVTLEERATCPRSCKQWLSCYGNSMHLARRNDHRDPDFLVALKAEVVTVARQHPDGFVVRLHTLGDFYSVEYVQLWADLLDTLPNLRCFGYTARREDEDDEESRRIAKAINWLRTEAWDLFAIRSSGSDGPMGSIVVREDDPRPTTIMCPAQKYATHACVTCGLCSSPEAKDKAIGFLLHGPKKHAAPLSLEVESRQRDRKETNRLKRIERASAITEAKPSPSNPSQGNDGDPDGAPAFRPPEPAPVKYPSVREPQEEKGSASDVVASARARISVAGQRT